VIASKTKRKEGQKNLINSLLGNEMGQQPVAGELAVRGKGNTAEG